MEEFIIKGHFMYMKPSSSLTLEELRFLYNLEENRRNSIESKANILLAFIGILFPSLMLISQNFNIRIYDIIYIWLGICGLFTIILFIPRSQKRPHNDYCNFYLYVKMQPNKLYDQFIINYIESLTIYQTKNNRLAYYIYILYGMTILILLFQIINIL